MFDYIVEHKNVEVLTHLDVEDVEIYKLFTFPLCKSGILY